MRNSLVCALAVTLALPAAPAQSRDVLRLKPSSPWNLHYADDSCRLSRNFGEGTQQVTMILDQFEPGDQFRMMFAGTLMQPRRQSPPITGAIRFGPQEAESEITVERGNVGAQRALFVSETQRLAPMTDAEEAAHDQAERRGMPFEPAPIGAAREAAATWLELKKVLRNDLVLETGSMGKPLAGLRQCSWDTVRKWGLDVEQQKGLTRKPHAKVAPQKWFDSDDYPRKMLFAGHQGIVNLRIMVDASGNPASCHIQRSTRPKEFDDMSCKVAMKNARFEPALDAQGKPVPSYWLASVLFLMER